MMSGLGRPIRIVLAASISLLLLPCFGFGVFGFLASGEPGVNTTGFRLGYSVFLLVMAAGCFFLWKTALRRHPTDHVGVCSGCGYSLQGIPEARCPECGRSIDFSSSGGAEG